MERTSIRNGMFRFFIEIPFQVTLVSLLISPLFAHANPTGGNVTAGNATISQNGNNTVINQTSSHAIINWQQFNIGANETTHFQQPAGGMILNRIDGSQGASQIYGGLTATGQVILLNPAGVYFGPSAHVNVGSLIATTAGISDSDFLSGNYRFNQASPYHGSIINEGSIVAANHGLIALIGESVSNTGMIQANLGQVALGAGSTFTINFAGNQLVSFSIDAPTQGGVDQNGHAMRDAVHSSGSIMANGGQVIVSAKTAAGVLDHSINMQGLVEARSVGTQNGEIILSGGENGIVEVAGSLKASGRNAGEKGGKISITGEKILVNEHAYIDASGDLGGGNIYIGGNYQGKGSLQNAIATVIAPTAMIRADALTIGNGGTIIVWADDVTRALGIFSARGGMISGNGGFVETSGHRFLTTSGSLVDLSAPNGLVGIWLLDPRNLIVQTGGVTTATPGGAIPNLTFTSNVNDSILTVADLQAALVTANVTLTTGAGGAQAGNITIANDVTWSSGRTLTLNAINQILLNASLTPTSGGRINFNSPIVLGANVNVGSTTAGDIVFGGRIDDNAVGTHFINITSAGSKVFLDFVGAITAPASITMGGTGTNFLVTTFVGTVGSQTYESTLSLSGATQLAMSGNGTLSLNGVIGGFDLTLTGGGTDIFNVAGPFNLTSLSVSGAGASNTLFMNTTDNQSWLITDSVDTGTVSNIAGITGGVSFFGMQNVTGGSGSNTFSFTTASPGLSGILDGGSSGNNFIDLTNRATASSAFITSGGPTGQLISVDGLFSNAQNIGTISANVGLGNSLTISKNNTVVTITGGGQGVVGDPIFFNGFTNIINNGANNSLVFNVTNNFNGSTALINGVNMFFSGFTLGTITIPAGVNVASIIQGPIINAINPALQMLFFNSDDYLYIDIDNLILQANLDYENYLANLEIIPNCGGL